MSLTGSAVVCSQRDDHCLQLEALVDVMLESSTGVEFVFCWSKKSVNL
jgi:hypothetical protein